MVKWVSLLLALSIASHPAVAAIPNPVLMNLSPQTASDGDAESKKGGEKARDDAEKILILSAVTTALGIFLMLNGGLKEERELIGEASPWYAWVKTSDGQYDYIETKWEGDTLKSYGVRYVPDAMGTAGIILTGLGITGLLIGLIAYEAESE